MRPPQRPTRTLPQLVAALLALVVPVAAQESPSGPVLPAGWAGNLSWRSIGPANMSGRITAIAVHPRDPSLYWIATASGGLLKTVNRGITFEHQFDRESTVSLGDVAVSASNPDVVWVGTGEANPRNSVSYGDGVYKSTNGGRTWTNMGLKETFQIGKVVIHPTNPDIVYVGALGRLYGPNPERGLYKTTDGGKSWNRILHLDDRTGVIDMVMNPRDPDTLLVAMWERQRDGFDSFLGGSAEEGYDTYDPAVKWGKSAGIYKTTDGGRTFRRLTKGLPGSRFGRVGLCYYEKNPDVVFAVVDCERIGMGTPPSQTTLGAEGADREGAVTVTAVTAGGLAQTAGLQVGDVIVEIEGRAVTAFAQVTDAVRQAAAGARLRLRIRRGEATREILLTIPAGRVAGPGGDAYMGIQGADAPRGARLTSITAGGPAEQAGLQEGDVIRQVNGRDVGSYDELVDVIRAARVGDRLRVRVDRAGAQREVLVTLQARPQGPGGGFGGPGGATRRRPFAAYYAGQRENVQNQQGPDGHEYGGIYRSADGGETWTRVNSLNPRPMYFSVIRVDPSDENHVFVLGISFHVSSDGGKTFRTRGGIHADGHALWIDPRDGRHMLIGTDGGTYQTYDRGERWDHLNHAALGQFYHVAVCSKRPYYVYGGLQDNGTWGGPSMGLRGSGPINEDWVSVGGGDGFVCRVDPDDPDLVYYESQNGAMARRNLRTGERATIRPQAPQGSPPYRFNWNTPFILSSHNPRIFYCGAQYVLRSVNRGDNLKVISPEITLTRRGSATALAESPRNPDVLWAGTDDGALWVTRDGGKEWTNVWKKVGLPGPRWVATIEPSRFAEGRCYVAFDGHRSNDDVPYVYVTEDFGETWRSLRGNLPAGSSRCLREDAVNPGLLYLGTEFGFFVSLSRGISWTRANANLPTVAVHEVAVHPTAGEIVAATHGRSLWVLDVNALRQLTPEVFGDRPTLLRPNDVVRWRQEPQRGGTTRRFNGQNPPGGATFYYVLPRKAERVRIEIYNQEGDTVATLTGSSEPGLQRVTWNTAQPARRPQGAAPEGAGIPGGPGGGGRGPRGSGGGGTGSGQATGAQGAGGGRPPGAGGGFGGFGARPLPPGIYRVVLHVDDLPLTQLLQIVRDPRGGADLLAEPESGDVDIVERVPAGP